MLGSRSPLLILPYSIDTNDGRFFYPGQGQTGDGFFDYLKDSFDVLRAAGDTMLTVGLHARIIARPGRIGALYRLLVYIAGQEDAWICRRSEIAQAWANIHPLPTREL